MSPLMTPCIQKKLCSIQLGSTCSIVFGLSGKISVVSPLFSCQERLQLVTTCGTQALEIKEELSTGRLWYKIENITEHLHKNIEKYRKFT
jgi:hypothetical protein